MVSLFVTFAMAEPLTVGLVSSTDDGTSETFALYRCLASRREGVTLGTAPVPGGRLLRGELDLDLDYVHRVRATHVLGATSLSLGAGALASGWLLGLANVASDSSDDSLEPTLALAGVGGVAVGVALEILAARVARPNRYRWTTHAELELVGAGLPAAPIAFETRGDTHSRAPLEDVRALVLAPVCDQLILRLEGL